MHRFISVKLPCTAALAAPKKVSTFLVLLILLFSTSLSAQFYQDIDGDGLGDSWGTDSHASGVTNNLDADDSNSSVGISFSMPQFVYGVVNEPIEIHFRNLFYIEESNYGDLTCSVILSSPSGVNDADKWSFTPSLAGVYNPTIEIKLGATTLASQSFSVLVSPESFVGTNSREVLMFGHSFIAGGWQLNYLNGDLASGTNPPYSLVGTNGIWVDPNINHDGYSARGWDYFTGTNSPITTGTAFNFDMPAYYSAINAGAEPEYVVIQLETNDFVFNGSLNQTFTSVAALDNAILSQWATHADPVVDELVAAGCSKVAICLLTPMSRDASHVGSSNWKLMELIQRRVSHLAQAQWGGREGENIHLIPINTAINTLTEYEDLVHPGNTNGGYSKVAGQVYAWLKYQFQTSHSCGTNVITWVGGTGDWDVASNWDCSCIPTSDDVVIIDGAASIVTVPSGFTGIADSLSLQNGADLTVMGSLSIDSKGLSVDGTSAISAAAPITTGANSVVKNEGIFHLANSSINGAATFDNATTGTISGNGTIGLAVTDAGMISPGDSPGAITFSQNFVKSQGDYLVEIESTSSHDAVTVTGIASLSGTLTITFLNSFSPVNGDAFDILHYPTGKIGTFQNTVLPDIAPLVWTLDYQSDKLVLKAASVLPVDLLHFSGENIDGGIELSWSSASEYNVENYTIQRLDNKEWNSMKSVAAIGFAEHQNNYVYLDKNPKAGTNFYRLISKDFDGTSANSNVISVENKGGEPLWWASKTADNQLFIHFPESDESLQVQVLSLDGRMVFEQYGLTPAALQNQAIQLPNTGLYFIKIKTENGVFARKI